MTKRKGKESRGILYLLAYLCLPDPPDALSQADVVGLELVQTQSSGEGESSEEPVQERPGLGNTALGEVVDD